MIRVLEEEKNKGKTEKVLKEIVAKTFPNFERDVNLHIKEIKQILNRINLKRVLEEEREKGADNLSEESIAGNFPNLGKETYLGPERRRNPKRDKPKEVHTKIHYNLNGKIKDKQRILKAAREKQLVT